jgi:hypothetical protein
MWGGRGLDDVFNDEINVAQPSMEDVLGSDGGEYLQAGPGTGPASHACLRTVHVYTTRRTVLGEVRGLCGVKGEELG